MQKMKKKIAFMLTACMMFSSALPVNASPVKVNGDGTTTKYGIQYNGDIVGGTLTNGSTDIDVKAKVSGGSEIVYDLDIEYGTMQFEYDYGSSWNPSTHTYTAGTSGAQAGGWVDSALDDANNLIKVTNNSNFPMKADFTFALGGTTLNASQSGDSVVGIFADANTAFTADVLKAGANGSKPNTSATMSKSLEMNITALTDGQTYYYKTAATPAAADTIAKVYFALSGKPDRGGPVNFTSVGKITVDISPETGATQATK